MFFHHNLRSSLFQLKLAHCRIFLFIICLILMRLHMQQPFCCIMNISLVMMTMTVVSHDGGSKYQLRCLFCYRYRSDYLGLLTASGIYYDYGYLSLISARKYLTHPAVNHIIIWHVVACLYYFSTAAHSLLPLLRCKSCAADSKLYSKM